MEVYLVSRCCGATFEEVEEVESWDEIYICDECLDFCEVQNDYDYKELARYDRAESMEDERKDMGL